MVPNVTCEKMPLAHLKWQRKEKDNNCEYSKIMTVAQVVSVSR